MSRKIILASVVFLILVLGGYFAWTKLFIYFVPTYQRTDLASFISSKSEKLCTFQYREYSAKFYFAGGKARGEYYSTKDKTTQKNYIIFDGSKTYLWDDKNVTGVITPYQPVKNSPASLIPSTGYFEADQTFDLTCKAWKADNNMFSPPKNIAFTFLTPATTETPNSSEGGVLILPNIPNK